MPVLHPPWRYHTNGDAATDGTSTRVTPHTGAVTLVQRWGSVLNLVAVEHLGSDQIFIPSFHSDPKSYFIQIFDLTPFRHAA